MLKKIMRYVGMMAIEIVLGVFLLWLAYLLPTTPMKENVKRSTGIYDYEGVYPQLFWSYKLSQLDNCTDAIMLLNAIYGG